MWRCYKPYGCFYIGAPWSGENRPVSMFPARPDSINPRYLLYTRDCIDQPHELKIDRFDTIKSAPFRLDDNFYFIIHGFLDNGDDTWVMVSVFFFFFEKQKILIKRSHDRVDEIIFYFLFFSFFSTFCSCFSTPLCILSFCPHHRPPPRSSIEQFQLIIFNRMIF